ncbi:MAG TPA: hypothetical protein V6C76_10840 [Drouetiella sp.]
MNKIALTIVAVSTMTLNAPSFAEPKSLRNSTLTSPTSSAPGSSSSSLHQVPLGSPLVAGVVNYTSGSGTGLSAVFAPNLKFGNNTLTSPGYILTGNSQGLVGINIPSTTSNHNLSLTQFYGAVVYIASPTNFSTTVPFQFVVTSADGVKHTCSGTQGTYHFHPASSGGTAYSEYKAVGTQFSPSLGLGNYTVNKAAVVYTGTGTIPMCAPVFVYNNVLQYYNFATANDTKFNYQ